MNNNINSAAASRRANAISRRVDGWEEALRLRLVPNQYTGDISTGKLRSDATLLQRAAQQMDDLRERHEAQVDASRDRIERQEDAARASFDAAETAAKRQYQRTVDAAAKRRDASIASAQRRKDSTMKRLLQQRLALQKDPSSQRSRQLTLNRNFAACDGHVTELSGVMKAAFPLSTDADLRKAMQRGDKATLQKMAKKR